MKFTHEMIDGVTVIRLDEKRVDTSNSGLLKGEITHIIKSGNVKKLAIDMTAIEQCDSSGLSALLVANRLIEEESGSICIVPSEKISQLFAVTKLDRILVFSSTLSEAIERLNQ
jgi:anti-anti-sigma factor